MADTDKKGGEAAPKKAGPTKAQSELDRYRAKQGGATTSAAASPGAFAGPVQWAYVAPQGGPGQGWPLPPSVMPMGAPPGMMPYPGAGVGGAYQAGLGNLGTTLGLGVDMMNALLAGGIGLLQRIGAGYGYAPQGYFGGGHTHGCGCGGGGGCGCGSGCGCDSCKTECGYDCCCTMGASKCCNPGVGSCC